MNKEYFIFLFRKYLAGDCQLGEISQLLEAMRLPEFHDAASEMIEAQLSELSAGAGYSSPVLEEQLEARLRKIQDELGFRKDAPGKKSLYFFNPSRMWWVAAMLLIAIGAGIWTFMKTSGSGSRTAFVSVPDFPPGHNGAILQLSNGKTIMLDSAQNGTVAMQGQIQAIKVNGSLKYVGNTIENAETLYNTVSTGRGRQWQLTLPDGTKVWLNAASSLRYPLSFSGKERMVEVTGEAYFEVVHNEKMPFRVKTGNNIIEDLGTHFDINVYSDEPDMKVSLLEGKISITNGTETTVLTPGQQGKVSKDGKIKVMRDVDIDADVAWKNGLFDFGGRADLFTVMRQISRWYDLDVVYEGNISPMQFGGKITRNCNLSDVLKILAYSNVHFKIEGKKIIVMQ